MYVLEHSYVTTTMFFESVLSCLVPEQGTVLLVVVVTVSQAIHMKTRKNRSHDSLP
jgi:hypothetical protein